MPAPPAWRTWPISTTDFLPEEESAALLDLLAAWEEVVGLRLRDDVLALFEGEVAFAVALEDLDRIGLTAMTVRSGGSPDLERLLGGIVAVVGVTDPERFDASLETLLGPRGATLGRDPGGTRTVRTGAGATPVLRYRHDDGFLVVGLTRDALEGALRRAAGEGRSLVDAEDFRSVFAHLDPDPHAMVYVNLPRLQELLRSSNLIQAALAANPAGDRLYRRFVVETDWPAGIGWASYSVPDGSVQQTFTPFDIGTLARFYAVAIASAAGPEFMHAVDRGRQARTMADIRTIATAVEAYAGDHNRYPPNILSPSPVGSAGARLQSYLVPIYIREVPAVDGWGNPIYYESDEQGMEYRIFSYGKDGQPSSGGEGPQAGFDGDIILRNGVFIARPGDVGP
ncbi:MAG: type II secretion system protein GspG, partial [Nitrospinota bacterium]